MRDCEARYTRDRRPTTESPILDATGIFEVWPSDRMILGDEMKYNLIARWREALRKYELTMASRGRRVRCNSLLALS